MTLKCILLILLIFIRYFGYAQSNSSGTHSTELKKADAVWIQKIIDNWAFVCRNELKISFNTLPWIIFYDSSAAFHLNAQESLLPKFTRTSYYVFFAGRKYQLIKIPHSKQVWVPDRKPILFASFPTVTMPYNSNKKAFFIAPLPSFFHRLSTPDQQSYLDFLFLGNNIHELTHTRQLMFALPQLIALQKNYTLPESIDDNTIENTFGKNETYKKLFFQEKTHLWNAIFTNNKDSCLDEIKQALTKAKQRKDAFFAGDSVGYAKMDGIFLSLEGSAMWAQYKTMIRNAPKEQNQQQTLFWLLQRAPAWSQEEGLALFLLIDKLSPDWRKKFFGVELPSALEFLNEIISNPKNGY